MVIVQSAGVSLIRHHLDLVSSGPYRYRVRIICLLTQAINDTHTLAHLIQVARIPCLYSG
jgi:hypothetical protein